MSPHHRPPECNTMAMNFFQRRKFFKKANALDLTPLRLLGHTLREDAKVSVMMPRFHSTIWGPLLQPRTSRKFVPIKLDELGSATWLLIDGKRSVADICHELRERYPENPGLIQDLEERVSKFIFLLYDQRYITFREIAPDAVPAQ